jgi:hypothetical protein
VSLAEPNAPNPIISSMLEQTNPSTSDRVNKAALPTGGCGCKLPLSVSRRTRLLPLADQVMTQIELPPFHRPCNPLDLVAIEIIFGRIFEVL